MTQRSTTIFVQGRPSEVSALTREALAAKIRKFKSIAWGDHEREGLERVAREVEGGKR